MAKQNEQFTFEISLSVLDHLGRNLYRSFVTVLAEAISNSWDADAENVWIQIAKDKTSFYIEDDGTGMTADDFQGKFLKVGYSKRKGGNASPHKDRPYIGAKGIGKLALLSCAEKISIISKTSDSKTVSGAIDNTDLDEAIKQEMSSEKYLLGKVKTELVDSYQHPKKTGTIIYFENIKDNVRNTIPHLRKLVALYFRFSLVDSGFKIFVNKEPVTFDDIKELSEATEFLWNINGFKDPYLDTLSKIKNEPLSINSPLKIGGFIATVVVPKHLKIAGTEEKVGVDLFVNGRLRERDILRHMPDFSTRHVASYLYGQIHFDELDQDGKDRFTSSREGVVPNDEKYEKLIKNLKEGILADVSNKWDELRLDRGEDGDDENPRKTLQQRRARSLYNLSSKDYTEKKSGKVNRWVKGLEPDAEFNIPAYVDCFLSENLIRKYIEDKKIPLSPEAEKERDKWKKVETDSKNKANISIEIRSASNDLNYLSMDDLANLVDKTREPLKDAALSRDAAEYKPMRDALAHTSLLTDLAKNRLTIVYENIKARVRTLLSKP